MSSWCYLHFCKLLFNTFENYMVFLFGQTSFSQLFFFFFFPAALLRLDEKLQGTVKKNTHYTFQYMAW